MRDKWRITTHCLNLEKSAHHGDPISTHLFILSLEILFELIKNNTDIRGIAIFNHAFSYATCAIFLNYLLSVNNIINTFKVFPLF